jgi:hypothetical protein
MSANSEYSSAKRAATSGSALQQELDNMSTEELLEEMKKAIDSSGEWTVRHRFMGGVLAYRAVQDASRSKKIRAIVQEHGGIQKKDIIDYIAKNPTYSAWVKHHLGRVEFQSYQALITKVLQKAGYERVGTKKTGRFVRWNLPKSAQEDEAVSDDEMEEAENDIDDNESASDDENKPSASADSSNGSGSDDESDEGDEKDDGDENVASGEDSHASHINNEEDDISSEGGSPRDEQLSDTNTENGLPKGDNLDQDEASSGSEDDSNLDQNMDDAGEHDVI